MTLSLGQANHSDPQSPHLQTRHNDTHLPQSRGSTEVRHIFKHPGQPGPDRPLPETQPWAPAGTPSLTSSDLLLPISSFPAWNIRLLHFGEWGAGRCPQACLPEGDVPWIRAQRGSAPLVQGSSLQSSRGPEDGSCFTPPPPPPRAQRATGPCLLPCYSWYPWSDL